MDDRLDPSVGKILLECTAVLAPYWEYMPHASLRRRRQLRQLDERILDFGAIPLGNAAADGILLVEVRQFYPQERRLYLVKA